jgi:C-terminal processing protease CtpA/Prc
MTPAGVQSFRQAYQIVKNNYAQPVNDHNSISKARMLRVLDTHSTFFEPQDYALMLLL